MVKIFSCPPKWQNFCKHIIPLIPRNAPPSSRVTDTLVHTCELLLGGLEPGPSNSGVRRMTNCATCHSQCNPWLKQLPPVPDRRRQAAHLVHVQALVPMDTTQHHRRVHVPPHPIPLKRAPDLAERHVLPVLRHLEPLQLALRQVAPEELYCNIMTCCNSLQPTPPRAPCPHQSPTPDVFMFLALYQHPHPHHQGATEFDASLRCVTQGQATDPKDAAISPVTLVQAGHSH